MLTNSIAFSMSTDGGFTWSAPVQVNQTPTDIAPANQQAFVSSIQVAGDGAVGVTYYDFRFNDADPGLPTDYWFVHGRLNQSGVLHWGHELRLTEQSFDLEMAPDVGGGLLNTGGLFLGDYAGLAASGSNFMSFFARPFESNPANIFYRAIGRRTAGASDGEPVSLVLPTAGIPANTVHVRRETPRDAPRWATGWLPDPLRMERRDQFLTVKRSSRRWCRTCGMMKHYGTSGAPGINAGSGDLWFDRGAA